MTLIELKAKAYDCLAQLEYWQNELNKYNELISNFKEEDKKHENNSR